MKNIVPTKLSYISIIPEISDEGCLMFAEAARHVPFEIKRFYMISHVDTGAVRGFHAHKHTQQMLFCVKGEISVVLNNGSESEVVNLNHPTQGLFLDALMWHEMKEFSKDTILLVVASDYFLESDYIRNFNNFTSYLKELS